MSAVARAGSSKYNKDYLHCLGQSLFFDVEAGEQLESGGTGSQSEEFALTASDIEKAGDCLGLDECEYG